jgi:hypothetical protein
VTRRRPEPSVRIAPTANGDASDTAQGTDAYRGPKRLDNFTIETFNDGPRTNHAMILAVLVRARENIAAGRFRPQQVQSSSTLLGNVGIA